MKQDNLSHLRGNNKDADQTGQMRGLVYAFVVHMQQSQVFSHCSPYVNLLYTNKFFHLVLNEPCPLYISRGHRQCCPQVRNFEGLVCPLQNFLGGPFENFEGHILPSVKHNPKGIFLQKLNLPQ